MDTNLSIKTLGGGFSLPAPKTTNKNRAFLAVNQKRISSAIIACRLLTAD
jgi:hypothetical protein